jgi:hypothetical protein
MKGVILMRKAMSIFVVVLFVFALTSVSLPIGAKGAAAATGKKTTGHKKIKQVSGEVTALDVEATTLIVEGITIKADKKMLSDIKVGDKVTVKYFTKGGNVAVLIIRQ